MVLLEPKRIENRMIKLQQKNKRLLMENDVLTFDYLRINNSWDFELHAKYIKTKKIKGDVYLSLNHIPKWIKDIEIDGSFDCSHCNLTSLENCPKIINDSFYCQFNKLTSFEDGPTFVGNNYYYYSNSIQFTHENVRSICQVNGKIVC